MVCEWISVRGYAFMAKSMIIVGRFIAYDFNEGILNKCHTHCMSRLFTVLILNVPRTERRYETINEVCAAFASPDEEES